MSLILSIDSWSHGLIAVSLRAILLCLVLKTPRRQIPLLSSGYLKRHAPIHYMILSPNRLPREHCPGALPVDHESLTSTHDFTCANAGTYAYVCAYTLQSREYWLVTDKSLSSDPRYDLRMRCLLGRPTLGLIPRPGCLSASLPASPITAVPMVWLTVTAWFSVTRPWARESFDENYLTL